MAKFNMNDMGKWADREKRKLNDILQESVRLLVAEVVKAMPLDTGNLSRSIEVSLDGVRPMDRDPNATYLDPSAANAATLVQAKAGKPVYISVTAPYAQRINQGYTRDGVNQSGTFYILIGANKWPVVVRQAIENVKAKYA